MRVLTNCLTSLFIKLRKQAYQRFFVPQELLAADPNLHSSLIALAEQAVYGREGIELYESREADELRRLGRRSIAQYLCHEYMFRSNWIRAARFLVCGACVLPLAGVILAQSLANWLRHRHRSSTKAKAVTFLFAERNLDCIDRKTLEKTILHRDRAVHVGRGEVLFLLRLIVACPSILLYPGLQQNVLRWVVHYGYVLRQFDTPVVINFFERTPSSSLMTAFLREHGRRHINVQHGERLFIADAAFSEFDECRVWSQYFQDLFAWQRSRWQTIQITGKLQHQDFFKDERYSHQPRPKRMLVLAPLYDSETDSCYRHLVDLLSKLGPGWEVRIRRHPGESRPELPLFKSLCNEMALGKIELAEESPEECSIKEALSRTRVIVGAASAAMLDAWVAGCKLVHLPSIVDRATLMDRYGQSPNVIYGDQTERIEQFLNEPAVLDAAEARRVSHLTRVDLEEKAEFSASPAA